jgi:Transposase IS4
MDRGKFKQHIYHYRNGEGEKITYGLVCWKDRDVVYCLTNNTNTTNIGSCYQCTSEGVKCIERPKVIGMYNTYMGGVDVADMRRMHCNSMLMGQNQWWLKLFFYLLDVSVENAYVLYNIAMDKKEINLVEFKEQLVMSMVGHKIQDVPTEIPMVHEIVKLEGRYLFAYCALFSIRSRTQFRCNAFNIALCMVGLHGNESNCFSLCHATENVRQMCIRKFEDIQKKANKKEK